MKKQRMQFADTMLELGVRDPSLVVLVGDISHGILQDFAAACPSQFYNIGICEPTIVNMAAGLRKVGLTPVVHTIAPFITERSYEQIKLDFGYQELGVNIISVGGSFDYSQLGCSHHCYTDISLFSHLASSEIYMPGSAVEFSRLFEENYKNGKINYFRLSENNHGINIDPLKITSGKGIKVTDGSDVTVAVLGSQLKNAYAAAQILRSEGIGMEVLYFPCVKPLDQNLILESVKKTKRLITLEELSRHGGLYHMSLEAIQGIFDVKVHQMAINDFVRGYGTYEELCQDCNLDATSLIQSAIHLVKG